MDFVFLKTPYAILAPQKRQVQKVGFIQTTETSVRTHRCTRTARIKSVQRPLGFMVFGPTNALTSYKRYKRSMVERHYIHLLIWYLYVPVYNMHLLPFFASLSAHEDHFYTCVSFVLALYLSFDVITFPGCSAN